jgi:glycosyltransferase involved in cell wall biosynthesis
MNVLLIGHACGPGLGSEPGFTWNWAQFLSITHRVWVIAYPEHRIQVEAYLAQHPNPNLCFVWVTTKHFLDRWKPERGERGIRIHYMCWLPEAYKRAAELCREVAIDVAHHVSLGTVGAPPPLWRLPVPKFWGPIGGGQTTPPPYLSFFGRQHWAERIRTARVKLLQLSRKLRVTARSCSVIFATNRDTADLLNRAGATGVRMLLDCGLPPAYGPACLPSSLSRPRDFTLLWAGRLEHRKGLALALQALAKVKHTPVKLLIAGRGPQQEQLESLTRELGLAEQVRFLGSVPYDQMPGLFESTSAFLFTSLRDSFGSVVLEAMAHGLPVITLDHQGVGTFVPDTAAVKVAVSNPEQTIAALASAIEEMAASPGVVQSMRLAAWSFAREHTWDRRAERMSKAYEEVVAAGRGSVPANVPADPDRTLR